MSAIEDDPEDLLVTEYRELRQAVADQVRAVTALTGQVREMGTHIEAIRGEVARKTGPEAFKQSLAEILAGQTGVVRTATDLKTAFQQVPAGVQTGVTTLTTKLDAVAADVRSQASAAKVAADEGKKSVATVAGYVQQVADAAVGGRNLMWFHLATVFVAVLVAGTAGWFVRGWADPPPTEAFAAWINNGNRPDWLLCKGSGEQWKAQNGARACTLKFWLDRPNP